jgi:hypothetical protein
VSTSHTFIRAAALVLVGVSAAACTSTGAVDRDPTEYRSDVADDEPLAGVVRIVSVDRSSLNTDGTVRYRVKNLTGEDQQSLAARVVFYYPPSEDSGIELPFETDVIDVDLPLFKGQDNYELVAVSEAFEARSAAGYTVLATELDVTMEVPVPVVARTASAPGTLLYNGRFECVGISPEDERLGLDGAAPVLWIELENVSTREVRNVQISAVFMDTQGEGATGETAWARLPRVDAGARERVTLDLSEAGPVRDRPFLVRVKKGSLFGSRSK